MDTQHTIDILTVHRENLLECKSFEEYRNAHVAYVDMLIERAQANLMKQKAIETWIEATDKSPPSTE